MDIFLEIKKDVAILSLTEKFIFEYDKIKLREKIDECLNKGLKHFVFDMRCLETISSEGLGCLIALHTKLTRNGAKMILAEMSWKNLNLFINTKLIEMFQILGS